MLLFSLKNDLQPLFFESERCENSFVIHYERFERTQCKWIADKICRKKLLCTTVQVKPFIQNNTKHILDSSSLAVLKCKSQQLLLTKYITYITNVMFTGIWLQWEIINSIWKNLCFRWYYTCFWQKLIQQRSTRRHHRILFLKRNQFLVS